MMCQLARPTILYAELIVWDFDAWCPKPADRSRDTGHRAKTRQKPTQR